MIIARAKLSTPLALIWLVSICWIHADTSFAENIVGWRTDGSGRYPKATPPVEWSPEKNVVWKTPMPGRSFGSPVVVGDRAFVVSDPAELMCVRLSDGKILWQHSNTPVDVFGMEQGKKILDEYAALVDRHKQARSEYGKLRKENPDAKDKIAKLKQQNDDLQRQINDMVKMCPVGGGRARNTSPTPISDGRSVYAMFATGIVAAYTLDGERQWIKFVEGSTIGFGHSSSPALVDGKLVVHFTDLVALDTMRGEEVWRVQLPANHATPIPTRVGETSVLISPSGRVVRATDGKLLNEDRPFRLSECSPILHEGVIFAHENGKLKAFRLPERASSEFAMELLWDSSAARDRRTPSTVYHDGLLYGVTTSGILDVTDAESGKLAYRERLDIGKIYSSATVAGDHIFISSTGGTTIVLKAGRKFVEVARNKLESLGSCPVFIGRRMYVRTQQHLYCIGK